MYFESYYEIFHGSHNFVSSFNMGNIFFVKKNYYSIIYIDNEGRHVRMLQYYKIIDLTCSPFFLCRCMRDLT
jgi:hypothetical protein